jgi:hypothetical protein
VLIFLGGQNQLLSITSTPTPGSKYQIPGVEINKSGGTLTIPSGTTIYVTGGWKVDGTNAGTVATAGSTVVFYTNGQSGSRSIDTGAGAGFDNVELASGSGSTLTIGTLKVTGDLTLSNVGVINAAPGAITVAGDLTSTKAGITGTADITMNGGNPATLKGGDFPDLGIVIAKTGGAVVTLGANFTNSAQTAPIHVVTGALDLAGFSLSTRGAFTVDGGAKLKFTTTGATQLTVRGNVTFASGSEIDITYGAGAGTYTLIQVTNGNSLASDPGAIYVLSGVTSKTVTNGVNGSVSITI